MTLICAAVSVSAQEDGERASVQLQFPANLELRLLVDYVSERMGMNILYGDEVGRARVTVKSPEEVPVETLPAILDSALRMNGLAMVDLEQPGWKRIVPVQAMTVVTRDL